MKKRRNLSSKLIINRTFKLINKYGQRYATFSKVSRELHVAPQALYAYFKNQQDLIIAVSIEYFHRMIKIIQQSVIGVSGVQAIMKYLETMRKYGLQNVKVNSMAFSNASSPQVQEAIKPLANTLLYLLKPLYKTLEERHVISRELINQVIGELINEEIGLFPNSIMNHKVSFVLGLKQILQKNKKQKR